MSDRSTSIQTLASTIEKGIENRLKDLHTAMPGIIQSFDAAGQTASVQPTIRRIFITREEEIDILTPADLPILINVPIVYPRGGGFSLTFPIAPGDECLLVFSERSLDNWHTNGGVRTPSDRRFHHLSDAVAFVGLSSIPNKVPLYNTTGAEIKKDDGSATISLNADQSISIDSNVEVYVNAPTTVVNSDMVTIDAPETRITGRLVVDQNIESPRVAVDGVEMHQHTHVGSPTAGIGNRSSTGVPNQ